MKWLLIGLGALAILIAVVALVGALLPKRHVATRVAVFKRGSAELFAVIHDFAAAPQWRSDLTRVEILPPEAGKERFREHGSFGVITFVVEEVAAPSLMIVRIADTNLAFGGSWTYELAPVPEGTRLTITERGEVYNVFFRFLSRFVFSQHATIDKFLSALGRKFGETVIPASS